MRILHLWKDHAPRFFDVSHQLCLDSERFQSRLVTQYLIASSEGSEPEIRSVKVIPAHYLYSTSVILKFGRFVERWIDENRFHLIIRDELIHRRPDLIHCHFGTVASEVFPLLEKQNIPIVVSLYGNDVSESLRNSRVVSQYRKLCARGAAFIVLCDAAKERLLKIGCKESNVRVFNLAPRIEHYPVTSRDPMSRPVWITAARFVEKKGYFIQLDALKEVFARLPEATCTWIGYGPLESRIRDAVRQMGFDKKVRIVSDTVAGRFDDTYRAELKQARLFVLPSITALSGDDEGGPALTMIKAQATGLATVCTRFPGSERSLIEGETGWYCEPSSDALASKIVDAFSDVVRLERCGRNAEALVRREFSLNAYRDRLFEVYESSIRS